MTSVFPLEPEIWPNREKKLIHHSTVQYNYASYRTD
jgi:hypothetical protein